MSKFLQLAKQTAPTVVNELLEVQRRAESARDTELKAAVKIQSFWRGCKGRIRARIRLFAVLELQRFFRGTLARRWVEAHRQRMEEETVLRFFHRAATNIQRIFRGFRSRKYVLNFYARKRWLASVAQKNEEMKALLEQQYQEQIRALEMERQQREWEQREKLARSLHHLSSTRAIPGVLSSPTQDPAVAAEMEATLQQAVRSQLHRREMIRRSREAARRPVRERGTVRAAEPYDSVQEAKKMEERIAMIKRLGPDMRPQRVPRGLDLQMEAAHHSVHINTEYVCVHELKREEDRARHVSLKPFVATVRPRTELV